MAWYFPEVLSGIKIIPDVHSGCLEFADGPPRIINAHFPVIPVTAGSFICSATRATWLFPNSLFEGAAALLCRSASHGYRQSQFINLLLQDKV